jgi:hypothetical protein
VDSTSTPAFARRRNPTAVQRMNVQIDERIAALPSLQKIAKQRSASPSSHAASTWICGNPPPRQTRTDSVSTVRPDSISDNRCGRTAARRRSSTTCRPRRQPSATKTNVTPGSCRSPKSQQPRPATPSRRPGPNLLRTPAAIEPRGSRAGVTVPAKSDSRARRLRSVGFGCMLRSCPAGRQSTCSGWLACGRGEFAFAEFDAADLSGERLW